MQHAWRRDRDLWGAVRSALEKSKCLAGNSPGRPFELADHLRGRRLPIAHDAADRHFFLLSRSGWRGLYHTADGAQEIRRPRLTAKIAIRDRLQPDGLLHLGCGPNEPI